MSATGNPDAPHPGATARAIQYHYDVGDVFYRLWLDDSLTYSCALFDGNEDAPLEQAQRRKYDFHAEQSRARGAARVLDVGCGWGAGLERLERAHGVERAVGLTLSETQARHAAARGLDVRLESWSDHVPEAPYQAIISIGAFEHFARFGVAPRAKIEGYREFFERCRDWLEPGGRLSLQTMAFGDLDRRRTFAEPFIASQVFPESDLPRLADIAEASEGTFELIGYRNDRMDYARTYRRWFDRLRARRDEAVELVGEDVVRRYERYLRTFSYSFELGAFLLLRLTFRRIDLRRDPHQRKST